MGDIAITRERRRAVEFSFFTLADSGAFATHAPKRLNEALALVRPFRWEVWPPLVFTIFVSGPLFYFIIAAPFWWKRNGIRYKKIRIIRKGIKENEIRWYSDRHFNDKYGPYHLTQLNRIRFGPHNKYAGPICRTTKIKQNDDKLCTSIYVLKESETIPHNLLNKCIWFAITLFLRQCKC